MMSGVVGQQTPFKNQSALVAFAVVGEEKTAEFRITFFVKL
jgi:hypothetical protein